MKNKETLDTYKIIIPKEEPKQECLHQESSFRGYYKDGCYTFWGSGIIVVEEPKKEILEEAANKLFGSLKIGMGAERRAIWMNGAKWQQEQDKNKYSEEEVKKIAEEVRWQAIGDPLEFTKNFEKWFEQFKKK
jgi:hypothetical protein